MSSDSAKPQQELNEIAGALDVLFTLREEFAQWLEEAQSEERKEELENVFRHVAAMEEEYKRRREVAQRKLAGGWAANGVGQPPQGRHHRRRDARLGHVVAGTFDDLQTAVGPRLGEGVGGSRRAQEIVAALHDVAGDALRAFRLRAGAGPARGRSRCGCSALP